MPRRLRSVLNNAASTMKNANFLLDNCDLTLEKVDLALDRILDEGYILLEFKPNFSMDVVRAVLTHFNFTKEGIEEVVKALTPNFTLELNIKIPKPTA